MIVRMLFCHFSSTQHEGKWNKFLLFLYVTVKLWILLWCSKQNFLSLYFWSMYVRKREISPPHPVKKNWRRLRRLYRMKKEGNIWILNCSVFMEKEKFIAFHESTTACMSWIINDFFISSLVNLKNFNFMTKFSLDSPQASPLRKFSYPPFSRSSTWICETICKRLN